MYKQLDEMPELLQVDEVFVENQPTLINPVMKTVSAMLFSYFIMRGIHERIKTHSNITNVSFCSPASKIKVGGKEANDKVDNATSDKVYKVTKKLGVKFCKALISDNPDYLKMIESHKKQDDMADAFLQGFIKVFGTTLPKHYEDKIKMVDIDLIDDGNYEDNDDNDDIEDDNNVIVKIGKKKDLHPAIRKAGYTPNRKAGYTPNRKFGKRSYVKK
jgi:hypothetical protein